MGIRNNEIYSSTESNELGAPVSLVPEFSIIMPTYNSIKFVESAIRSVIAQNEESWELLICDDASRDGTPELLRTIASTEPRVKVSYLYVNAGAAATRNEALGRATGNFIAFLDSDDVWYPNKLESHKEFMGSSIPFSFSSYELIDENGVKLGKKVDVSSKQRVDYDDMLKKRATMGCLTVVLRRDSFVEIRMPSIRQGQDYALWLKLLQEVPYAYRLDKCLAKYRVVSGSISSNKMRKALRQWQIYRVQEKLSLIESAWNFLHYAKHAVFRK